MRLKFFFFFFRVIFVTVILIAFVTFGSGDFSHVHDFLQRRKCSRTNNYDNHHHHVVFSPQNAENTEEITAHVVRFVHNTSLPSTPADRK